MLCTALPMNAQILLQADSNHVETGNALQLHLRVPVALGKPDSLRFLVWKDVLPPQNMLQQGKWQMDGQYLHKTLTTLFFDEDSLHLAPLPIVFPNGDTLFSNAISLVVHATPAPDDLNDMAPIKDIHREPTLWVDYLPWTLGALGILAVLAGLFWLANRKPKPRMNSRSMEIPPHELAVKKLQVLLHKNLIVNGFVKEHYAELTFILREYLEKRFEVPALESTTSETLGQLASRDFPAHLAEPLRALLEQADLAKFAKIIPPETFHGEAMQLAQKIVAETAPLTSPPSPST